MLVECSQCKTRFRVQEEKIRPGGSKFKCSKCGAILSVYKTAASIIKEDKDEPVRFSGEQDGGAYKEPREHISDQRERRKHARYPFREEILIDGTKRCTCSDISELGLYVSTIQSFEEKGKIEVSIPYKENFLTVKAQVQYHQPGIGMGIMFLDLTDEQKTVIKAIIEAIKQE
jgi:predicted Zn finger-like uncharacterized protein